MIISSARFRIRSTVVMLAVAALTVAGSATVIAQNDEAASVSS